MYNFSFPILEVLYHKENSFVWLQIGATPIVISLDLCPGVRSGASSGMNRKVKSWGFCLVCSLWFSEFRPLRFMISHEFYSPSLRQRWKTHFPWKDTGKRSPKQTLVWFWWGHWSYSQCELVLLLKASVYWLMPQRGVSFYVNRLRLGSKRWRVLVAAEYHHLCITSKC